MCSVSINASFDSQLSSLKSDRSGIENKLLKFAAEANQERSGALDTPDCLLHDWPAELKHVRRKRFGRHRVFFIGHHKKCSYHAFYIKKFKQVGKEEEHDKALYKTLRSRIVEPVKRTLGDPKNPSATQTPKP